MERLDCRSLRDRAFLFVSASSSRSGCKWDRRLSSWPSLKQIHDSWNQQSRRLFRDNWRKWYRDQTNSFYISWRHVNFNFEQGAHGKIIDLQAEEHEFVLWHSQLSDYRSAHKKGFKANSDIKLSSKINQK